MYSATFAHFYDLLMGDYSSITNTTTQLVSSYIPKKSHILELGCGTGNMLQALSPSYVLSGLDNASSMLTAAKKKVPSATYYEEDMTTFSLNTSYDGIICIFDTINHLLSFSKWESLFRKAHAHLNPNGYFIFDMNTITRLNRLANLPPYVGKLDNTTLTRVNILHEKGERYAINFQIFENIQKNEISYTEEHVEEVAFPVDQVQIALKKYFRIEKMVDPIRKRITKNTGRIFFVCTKK